MNSQIRNGSEYNAGLKQRGSLTVWLDKDAIHHWYAPKQPARRGSNPVYSDLAITPFETLKSVYGLAGRQTEGLLHSLFELMQVSLSVPEHSTVSRRKATLCISFTGAPQLLIDSSGGGLHWGQGVRRRGVENSTAWHQ